VAVLSSPDRGTSLKTSRRILFREAIEWTSLILLVLLILDSCMAAPLYGCRILQAYPHDRGAFTQGLAFDDCFLYEGTGGYGESSIRKVDLATGRIIQERHLSPHVFGEGLAVWEDRLIQLTWREGVGSVYRIGDLSPLDTFRYSGEGWGITHDGRRLIVSDGTAELRFIDPSSFIEIGRLEVRDGGVPVQLINELEFVEGEIWANIWTEDRIARISPISGEVLGWIDLSGLLVQDERALFDVANGIAYDPGSNRIFVTGKLWPNVFLIEVVHRDAGCVSDEHE